MTDTGRSPPGLSFLRTLFARHSYLAAQDFLRDDLHTLYGRDTDAVYLHLLLEILMKPGLRLPHPFVLPEEVVNLITREGPSGQPGLLQVLLERLLHQHGARSRRYDPDPNRPGETSDESPTIGHLLPLDTLLRANWSRYLAPAAVDHLAALAQWRSVLGSRFHCLDRSVCIVGYHRSVLGLGEDARRLADVLLLLGCRVEMLDVSLPSFPRSSEEEVYREFAVARPTAPILIFCLPLADMCRVWLHDYPGVTTGRYVIACSPWELSALPACTDVVLEHVNEIWCATKFQSDTYQVATDRPVYIVAPYVRVKEPLKWPLFDEVRSTSFCFGFAFDFNSTIARKNPIGLIQAFKTAFPCWADEPVQLLMKTLNADYHPAALAAVMTQIGDDPRIILIDGDVPPEQLAYFLASVDVFASLHRSEGFGRLLAEAMMLGTPVLCTDWSGSRDFATHETALLVPCALVPVPPSEYPHAAGLWAEPDIAAAADAMRLSYFSKRDVVAKNCAAAHALAEARFSLTSVAIQVMLRFENFHN